MARRTKPGVMCLEGMWSNDLTDRSSVQPLLEVLERTVSISYVYRDIGTRAELDHYIGRLLQKGHARFGIAYLAFHGEPGILVVGRESVSLDELAAMIDGRGAGRVVFFGCCSTLDLPRRELEAFVRTTKVKAICGYLVDVDWIESAAFELLLIEALSRYQHMDAADRWMRKNYNGYCRRFKFKMVTQAATRQAVRS